MQAKTLKQKYLAFFKSKDHAIVPSASLVPQNDPTVLFNTAGMQPLVPYLQGEQHPKGKRIADVQKCLRTVDFENIGDNTHHTFFEMLGNWSLGDYFKKEAISWSFEFLTSKEWLGLPLEKLAFTVYEGKGDVPRDEESYQLWRSLGVPEERIAFLGEDNFWIAGEAGPCGPSTEMFYWTGKDEAPKVFDPEDERWVEIWNDVFMAYNKINRVILVDGMFTLYDKEFIVNKDLLAILDSFSSRKVLTVNGFREKGLSRVKAHGFEAFSLEEEGIEKGQPEFFERLLKAFTLTPQQVIYFDHKQESVDVACSLGIKAVKYETPKQIKEFLSENVTAFLPLKNKNVDTGMGLERTAAVLAGKRSAYETDLFQPIIAKISTLSEKTYEEHKKAMRIVADHLRAATFVLAEGVVPSNTDRGYILRRLIRRAIRFGKQLGITTSFTATLASVIVKEYAESYPELEKQKDQICEELMKEEEKFEKTLEKGLREFEKMASQGNLSGEDAFLLFQSYGFPLEMTEELADEKKVNVDTEGFFTAYEKHQELSRTATEGKFKGGLADLSDATIKLHTATHLLNEALRKVVSSEIKQRGSNITPERLRFDFSFDRKLTKEELAAVETEVNRVIALNLPVTRKEMPKAKAEKVGAQAEFGAKYPDVVSVYFVGDYSVEFCGGPHVSSTKEIGVFKIVKEQSSSAGVRRIKAVVKTEGHGDTGS